MAGVRWAAVVLSVFLSAGGSRADVDRTWLTGIVEGLKKEYALGDAFSLAASVPEGQDVSALPEVLSEDPADQVKLTLSEGGVYRGARVVAAPAPEAAARVLRSMQTLEAGSAGNFLVVYSEEAPCYPDPDDPNDPKDPNAVVQKWSGYAFVFSKVADASRMQLAASRLGLDHLFRCYAPGGDAFRCTGCSSAGGGVAPSCEAGDAPSTTEPGGGGLTGGGKGTGGGKVGESKRKGSKGRKVGESKRKGSKGRKVGESKRKGSKGRRVGESKRKGSKGGKGGKRSKQRRRGKRALPSRPRRAIGKALPWDGAALYKLSAPAYMY